MAEHVAIVGSRGYSSEQQVRRYVAALAEDTVIVSGGARGVDTWALDEARRRGMRVVLHRPDWGRYGKRAGFVRNSLIVRDCDRCVAFWDGQSRGTMDTVRKCEESGKPVEVLTVDGS